MAGLAVAGLNVLLPSLVKVRFPARVGDMTGLYTMVMVVSTAAAGLIVPIYYLTNESVTAALGIWCIPVAVALVIWAPQLRLGLREQEGPIAGA